MRSVWRSILITRAITSISKRSASQRKTLSSVHCILRVQEEVIFRDRNLSSKPFFPDIYLPTSINTVTDRNLMDVDEQRGDPIGADVAASHDHSSVSHDLSEAASPGVAVDHFGIQSGTDHNEGITPGSPPQSTNDQGDRGDDGEREDAYTKRGYTSEIFKIELGNLPLKIGYKVYKC